MIKKLQNMSLLFLVTTILSPTFLLAMNKESTSPKKNDSKAPTGEKSENTHTSSYQSYNYLRKTVFNEKNIDITLKDPNDPKALYVRKGESSEIELFNVKALIEDALEAKDKDDNGLFSLLKNNQFDDLQAKRIILHYRTMDIKKPTSKDLRNLFYTYLNNSKNFSDKDTNILRRWLNFESLTSPVNKEQASEFLEKNDGWLMRPSSSTKDDQPRQIYYMVASCLDLNTKKVYNVLIAHVAGYGYLSDIPENINRPLHEWIYGETNLFDLLTKSKLDGNNNQAKFSNFHILDSLKNKYVSIVL